MTDYEIPTEGFNWFWAPSIEDTERALKKRYGSGFYFEVSDDRDTVVVGTSWPKDTTEDPENLEITFKTTDIYTAPVYSGNGYEVTRLPSRPMMAQLFREAKHITDSVSADGQNKPKQNSD